MGGSGFWIVEGAGAVDPDVRPRQSQVVKTMSNAGMVLCPSEVKLLKRLEPMGQSTVVTITGREPGRLGVPCPGKVALAAENGGMRRWF
jgi:hypothetical protein